MTWLPTNCTRRQNGDADAACDQRIFDGRGAVFILHEAAHRAYVRLLHVETIQFRQFSHNSAIKCEIRGTSAGRVVMRTRPSASTRAQAATRTIFALTAFSTSTV